MGYQNEIIHSFQLFLPPLYMYIGANFPATKLETCVHKRGDPLLGFPRSNLLALDTNLPPILYNGSPVAGLRSAFLSDDR